MKAISTDSGDGKRRTITVTVGRTTLVVSVLATMCVVLILAVTAWSGTRSLVDSRLALTNPTFGSHAAELVCENGAKRAVIYNKSPKTASSFILGVMVNWTQEVGRPLYRCYRAPLLTVATIKSCVPKRPDPCGVFTEHVHLNPFIMQLFNERFPNHLLVTSTRYPAHRIVSMFLFTRKLSDDDPLVQQRLPGYLRAYNPWSLYNYHTGEVRTGDCPITNDEKKRIYAAVSRFDVVVDMNAVRASNVILKHHNLFSLPVRTVNKERYKERGAARVNMTDELLSLLDSKLCVEKELHMAFQFRMADLYDQATGEKCMIKAEFPKPDSCITREEQESLADYWQL